MKKSVIIALISTLFGALVVFSAIKISDYKKSDKTYVYQDDTIMPRNVSIAESYPDFTYAAEMSVKAVVFVKVVKRGDDNSPSSIFEYFFGFGNSIPKEQVGAGSGVIVSEDGFIVTNNHVVAGASEVEVTVAENKTFKADIIGTDPETDIALLKIDAKGLPTLPMGDSDDLRLGEWVLAIGSPYGLTSTITAGIVSAKGRSMPNYSKEFRIESFIQTDAAVNPGNSGGALVNIKGELVGINTAIISQTGSYAGYSFAVPVNIVKKIVEDFKHYGYVQRAILGISMINNTEDLKEEKNLSTSEGVYIAEVVKGSAAEKAGLKKGDILVSIDSNKVKTASGVQELITRYRPGDKIDMVIVRGEKKLKKDAVLIAKETQEINAYNLQGNINLFGAELIPAPKEDLAKLDIKGGVKVSKLEKGKMRDAGIKEGFIITYVNNRPVMSPQDIAAEVKKSKRSILIEGFYLNGDLYYYGIGL